MPFYMNFLGLLAPRVMRSGGAWDPHILVVPVITPPGEILDNIAATTAANQAYAALSRQLIEIDHLWGSFFDGWVLDVIATDDAARLISLKHAVPLDTPNWQATIVFPAALFPAEPNPRGRQSTSGHDIEGSVQEALMAHLYLMSRFLAGWHVADGLSASEASSRAISDLVRAAQSVLHLTQISQSGKTVADRNVASAEKFLENCIEKGPARWGELYADKSNKKAGQEMWILGQTERGQASSPSPSSTKLQLDAELAALVLAWEQARLLRLGQQDARRIMLHGPMTADEALQHIGLDKAQLDRVAGQSRLPPSLQMIADLGRRHELDVTRCYPSLYALRPLGLAMSAVSAFERRRVLPRRDTIEGVIVHHAILGMTGGAFQKSAAAGELDGNWPATMINEIAAQLETPLPRYPPMLPTKSGHIY